MHYWATEFFKVAAIGMPNVNTRGLVLPPPRQKVLSNMVNMPLKPNGPLNIKPQFTADPSHGKADPAIKQPGTGAIAKAAEFEGEDECLALEYFKMAQSAPLLGAVFPGKSKPFVSGAPKPPVTKPAAEATTRIIRKPEAKVAEFSALDYFALLGQ